MVNRIIRDHVPIGRSVRRVSNRKSICLNVGFLNTQQGLIKMSQVVIGGICESLLLNYGNSVSLLLGSAYTVFLTNSSACLLTASLLLFSYVISEKTHRAIENSIFEIVFNVVAVWLYVGASAYLMFMTSLLLWPLYLIKPFFQPYPALTAAASLGFFLAATHAASAYFAVRLYRRK